MKKSYLAEEFCAVIEKHVRASSIVVIVLVSLFAVYFGILYWFHAPWFIWFMAGLELAVTILILVILVPARIEITPDGRLVVHAYALRKTDYGKVLSIEELRVVPRLICLTGNRGFYGFWAWCSGPEGTVILISEKKCKHIYKIMTDKHTIYLCTSTKINTKLY